MSEYWTGIVFNGNKIGFSHFAVTPHPGGAGLFDIRSEAVIRFRFLMMEKNIMLRSYDLVDGNLCLQGFSYEYDMDGNRLELAGSFADGVLKIVRSSQGTRLEEKLEITGELYPASALYLYPFLKGLRVGNRHEYLIYDSETQSLQTVRQEIDAYQRSDLFAGEAYRVRTRYHGQEVTTWLDERGLPVLETALGGVLVSGLESEQEAGRYLLESSLNKDEGLLGFSLIRVSPPLTDAGSSTFLEMYLHGVPDDVVIPSDTRQECIPQDGRVLCRIRAEKDGGGADPSSCGEDAYLRSSPSVPLSTEVRQLASRITRGASSDMDRVRLIVAWMRENIAREPVDAFTALDVLSRRKAECQGHALLYTAFARSLGIPTRVANGIVYAEVFEGFLYHAWVESCIEGQWIAIDPTLDQIPADATHLKFIEGETLSSLVPLVSVVGRIGVRVMEVR